MAFIPGLELSRHFFHECVEPRLARLIPDLVYGAALIGDGSEVLGHDTAVSTDHDWGPKVQIFLRPQDFADTASTVIPALDQLLPGEFMGWPVCFVDRRRPSGIDRGVYAAGSPAHGVEMHTIASWTERRLGVCVRASRDLTPCDWLSIPEPILLSATRGEVFRDDVGELASMRSQLAWFPRDVWLYKLASQWARVSEEVAFVGRTGDVGDDLGSRVIAARLVHETMRVAFLMERRYAPYAKWIGREFNQLYCAGALGPELAATLNAPDWRSREAALGRALMVVAGLHRQMAVAPTVAAYFTRPYHAINAVEIAQSIFEAINDPAISALRRLGAIDQLVDNTAVLTSAGRTRAIAAALHGET